MSEALEAAGVLIGGAAFVASLAVVTGIIERKLGDWLVRKGWL